MTPNRSLDTYTFTRYLASKRSVDDRALNVRLWRRIHGELHSLGPTPVHILEIGGGIGTMVERLLTESTLPPLHYHLLDAEAENIDTAAQRLCQSPRLSTSTGHPPPPLGIAPTAQCAVLDATHQPHNLYLYATDLFDFLAARPSLEQVQLVVANAFLDLVDLPTTLAQFKASFRPGTLLYFTINFDGCTIFQPTIDAAFDAYIESIYHRTMDDRMTDGRPSGDSHTGRHLFHALQQAGIQVLDAGSSDWFVMPRNGSYPDDEAYFLHFIIHTMHDALIDHPEIDSTRFADWIDTRHRQIEEGELIYIAHQLDYIGQIPPDT